jgi:hypothetical protein
VGVYALEIESMSGGKAIEAKKTDSSLPQIVDPEGRVGHPGTLTGDADLRELISLASQEAHKVPYVEWLRIIFKAYQDVMYLLLIPLMIKPTAEEVKKIKEDNPSFYKLYIRKGVPEVTGLQKLFVDGGVPMREDQWVFCKAKLIKDSEEGIAVALNWTDARIEPRDILKERRMRAEASKRRREKKKQLGSGEDGVAAGKDE